MGIPDQQLGLGGGGGIKELKEREGKIIAQAWNLVNISEWRMLTARVPVKRWESTREGGC